MFVISDCSTATKTLARNWISTVMGAVHEDGHVEAICDKLTGSSFRSKAVLVNTLAYFFISFSKRYPVNYPVVLTLDDKISFAAADLFQVNQPVTFHFTVAQW